MNKKYLRFFLLVSLLISLGSMSAFIFSGSSVVVSSSNGMVYVNSGAMTYKEERVFPSYPLSDGASLKIENAVGQIEIQGWDKNEVSGKYIKWAASQEELSATDVTLDYAHQEAGHRDRIWMRTIMPASGRAMVHYIIFVPRRILIEKIKTISGDVRIQDIEGRVIAETVSGDVGISDMSGDIDAKTTSGDIRVQNMIGSIKMDSTSGDIRVENLHLLGSNSVETISGDINLAIERLQASLSAETTSGDVTLKLPSEASARIVAETTSGDISGGGLTIQERPAHTSGVGILGRGENVISLTTLSGDISVR